jgi:hypothetical protein
MLRLSLDSATRTNFPAIVALVPVFVDSSSPISNSGRTVMAPQDQRNEFSGSLNSYGAPIVAGAQLSTAGGSIYIGPTPL